MAATVVILACGDGVPDLIEEGELKVNIDQSTSTIIDKIKGKDTTIWDPNYVPPSSWEVPISSSETPIPQSSSDTPVVQSSSSGGGLPPITTSSSSAPPSEVSSSSKPSSSSASAPAPAGGCKESNPKGGFTCGWDGYTAGSVLVPGKLLKPAAAAPPAGCTDIAWKFAPDTTQMAQVNACKALPAEGVTAEGSRNYVLFAELTCDDGKHTTACNPKAGWSSKRAPEISGTCKWDRTPPSTTTARGSKPSGITISDPDKVCSSPTVDYIYDDNKKWDVATGILKEWKDWGKKDKKTYSDVTPTLNCPAYPATVTLPVCPALEVSAGADYIIECKGNMDAGCGGDAKKKVTLKADECVEVSIMGWDNQYHTPTVGMRCDAQGSGGTPSFVVSVNGKNSTISGNGLVTLGTIKVGDNEFGTLCLISITGASSITCNGPTQ
jgi:hypothetical protein